MTFRWRRGGQLSWVLQLSLVLAWAVQPLPARGETLTVRDGDGAASEDVAARAGANRAVSPAQQQRTRSDARPAVPERELAWGELVTLEEPEWWVPTAHSLGLMTTMRLTEAWLWPDPFAETRLDVIASHYEEAYTRPPKWDARADFFEWDGDPWYINAIGHAALGAELYYRPRACGHGALAAFGFAAVGTIVWDYGYEASGVRPSALDLWYTPLSGALIGEARYWGYQAAGSIDSRTWRAIVQSLIDPFGQIERSLGARC